MNVVDIFDGSWIWIDIYIYIFTSLYTIYMLISAYSSNALYDIQALQWLDCVTTISMPTKLRCKQLC